MALPVNKRVPKILFILFVVAFCVYLVPRVAINFFYYPDDKFTVPILVGGIRQYGYGRYSSARLVYPFFDGPLTTPSQPSFMLTAMPNMSAHWPLVVGASVLQRFYV